MRQWRDTAIYEKQFCCGDTLTVFAGESGFTILVEPFDGESAAVGIDFVRAEHLIEAMQETIAAAKEAAL